MFQLINPLWLFAVAAVSIPVAIHLWNIRPGKTLKVGSIALVAAASRKSSRSLNLMDILLLLLRCLFLALLAILLAQPYWAKLVKPNKIKGWVLIPRQNIHQIYTQYKPRVDSLTKAGYELHYFNSDFKAIDTLKFKTLKDSGKSVINNWVLLNQLSQQVSPMLPMYLFTNNLLNGVSSSRPQLALNLHVQTYTPADSVSKWIQSAALVSTGDAVKVIEGNSKPSGTTYNTAIVQTTEQRNSPYQINIINGQPSVSFKGDTTNKTVTVDTSTLRVAIYSDKNSINVSYLNAALTSVKQFTQRKIEVTRFTDANKIPAGESWLFWLSDRAIPAAIKAKALNLFLYQPGKVQAIHSWFADNSNIALAKHIFAAQNNNPVIWPDGFGNPVLNVEANGPNHTYHFYTHFDPAWNDLVWNEAFPRMMLGLINTVNTVPSREKRIVADAQLTPRITEDKTTVTKNTIINKTDLSKLFWLALVFIFLMERWLAHHNKSIEIDG